MAEKGGKGSSKAGKSSIKSPASLQGKDVSSTKSKKERRVQFDAEDLFEGTTPKSDGTTYKAASKGGGGKGDKSKSGDKSGKAKASSLEHRIEQELPGNTECLMDCEAADILQKIQDHMVLLSRDPAMKLPCSFDRGLMYARKGCSYSNPVTVRQILEPLKEYGIIDSEVCMIANIQVEYLEEVFALIPSLKGKRGKLEEPLKTALAEVTKLRSST